MGEISLWNKCALARASNENLQWLTSCVVTPAGGVLTGLAAGESVVLLTSSLHNFLVKPKFIKLPCVLLPWWLYDANCRMDFKDFTCRSTASNVYIFSTNLWVNVLNMSGICTAAPPHLDAHDKNSMYSYLYWSELGLNRRHAWMNYIFAILHIIIHADHIAQNWNCTSK